MKTNYIFLLLLCSLFTFSFVIYENDKVKESGGTKVFAVDYDYQADIKVFVVDYDYQADLKVFKSQYDYQANKAGIWYFTDQSYQADKKIFFTDYDYQADLKIFFVNYNYQAGWNNKSKMHLLY